MGARRWDGPAGEYGTVHGKQLLSPRILALLAPLVQPLDRALPLHSTRWDASARGDEYIDIHLRRTVA